MTESDIKREICEYLETLPNVLFTVTPPKRTKFNSNFMRAGWPDIFGIIQFKGSVVKPLFIEVKKPGGTLSVEQFQLLGKAKELGAITCVATCVDDVVTTIREWIITLEH